MTNMGIAREDLLSALSLIQPGQLMAVIADFMLSLAGAFTDIALIILVIIFLLVDAFGVGKKLQAGM